MMRSLTDEFGDTQADGRFESPRNNSTLSGSHKIFGRRIFNQRCLAFLRTRARRHTGLSSAPAGTSPNSE